MRGLTSATRSAVTVVACVALQLAHGSATGAGAGAVWPAVDSTNVQRSPTEFPRIFYEDDFRTNRNFSEGTSGPCRTSYGLDGYSVAVLPGRPTCLYKLHGAGTFRGRIRIETEFTLRRGNLDFGAGLAFGNETLEYALLVAGSGAYALVMANSEQWTYIVPWTVHASVHKGFGAKNKLAVEINGRVIRIYINETYLTQATVPGDVRGSVGMKLDYSGSEATFSHLVVEEYGAGGPVRSRRNSLINPMDFRTAQESRFNACAVSGIAKVLTLISADERGCRVPLTSIDIQGDIDHIRFEATALQSEGQDNLGFGLMFGYAPGARNIYYFLVSSNGQYFLDLELSTGGAVQVLLPWKEDILIHRGYGAENRLAVEVIGQTIRCFVNGKYLGEAVAPTEISPQAVGVFGIGRGTKVVFTDLRTVILY